MQSQEKKIRDVWQTFNRLFWALFFSKILAREAISFVSSDEQIAALFVVQILLVCGMVYLMGWSAFKMTGKRLYLVDGVFGFFWFATIGIFLGYFAVKQSRNIALRAIKVEPYPKDAGFFSRLLD